MAHPSCYFNVFSAGVPTGAVHLVGMATIWDRDRDSTPIGTIYRMQCAGYRPGEEPSPWIRHLRKKLGRRGTIEIHRSLTVAELQDLHVAVIDRWGPASGFKGQWIAERRYALTLMRNHKQGQQDDLPKRARKG